MPPGTDEASARANLRRVRRPLFLLLLATFALKAAVLAHFNAHPLLQPAGDIDGGVYARLAADVARGDLLLRGAGAVPFFVSPLYIYFLAAIHALSAGSLLAAKVVQIAARDGRGRASSS